MPRTASTRNIDGDRLRSRLVTPRPARPSAAEARAAAELPPILFRLPALATARTDSDQLAEEQRAEEQLLADQIPEQRFAEQRFAADDDRAPLTSDLQHASMPDVPESPVVSNRTAGSSSVRGPVQQVTLETFGASSNPVNATASETALATANAAPVAATAPVVTAPAAAASTGPTRTWWEHWSSGVVLILLIIALVTASIIALNDSGKAKPEHLASQAETSMVDEFDLSGISIPAVSIPVAPAIVPAAERTDETLKLATTSTPVVAAPPAVLAPQTTLDQPVGVAAPQLFANEPTQGKANQNNLATGIPSMTASNPTVSLELSNAAPSTNGVMPVGTATGGPATDGASPTFYDGASRIGEQHAAALSMESGGGIPTAERRATLNMDSGAGPIDTNMPSYPTILASATRGVSSVEAEPKSAFSTASHVQPVNPSATLGLPTSDAAVSSQYTSQYANPTTPGSAVPSATPELNANSLVSEYLKYERMRLASEGTAENRYPGSTTLVPQQSGVPQAAASGKGFTLGAPQN